MAAFRVKRSRHKLKGYKFEVNPKKITFCKTTPPEITNIDLIAELSSSLKAEKIVNLIRNIYIYKFPPVLHWPDGVHTDIPVDYVIAIRKIFEHFSILALNNVNEICFSLNSNYSSYGDKIIIIPIEYVFERYNKALFMDIFAHEVAHSLMAEVLKDDIIKAKLKSYHKIISYYSKKSGMVLFFDPETSDKDLARYQLEDYKEFFAELASQILNYYNELIRHICSVEHEEAQNAYLEMTYLLLNYVIPFNKRERAILIENLY